MLRLTTTGNSGGDSTASGARADHDAIEVDRTTFFRTPGDIAKYRNYAAGTQTITLSDEQQATLAGLLDNDFADNVCHQIVSESADRIDLLRFSVPLAPVMAFLSDFFAKSRLEDISGEVHYAALRDGNHAVSLGWDNDAKRVTIRHEPWWDGNTGVFIAYDAGGVPLYAVKEFDTLEGRRRVVWFEDQIERYISQGGGAVWQPYVYPGEDGHVQPWVKADGSPLHIPIIHFANGGRAGGWYGASELAGGVLGFQDQLNDLQFDISAAARMTGYQMLYVTGTKLAVDAQGAQVAPVVGPGAVFHSEAEAARYGVLQAGDITQLINTYLAKLKSVSRMTRTPLHSITGGDWPSGEALLRSELPSINKARKQIRKFSPAWQMAAHRATEIANAFGKANLDEDAIVDAQFAQPDQRDAYQLAQIVNLTAQYLSRRERLRALQYSEADIDRILAEKAEDDQVILAKQAAEFAGGAVVNDTTRTSLPE